VPISSCSLISNAEKKIPQDMNEKKNFPSPKKNTQLKIMLIFRSKHVHEMMQKCKKKMVNNVKLLKI